MLILVTGSRHHDDTELIHSSFAHFFPGTHTLIHGAARGADRIAATYAKENHWGIKAFPADWERYGRAAGAIRNNDMLQEHPEIVIGFPIGDSIGTYDCMNQAKKRQLPVILVSTTGNATWYNEPGLFWEHEMELPVKL